MSQHLLLNGGKKRRLFNEWMLSRPDIVFIADSEEGGDESLFCETATIDVDEISEGIICEPFGWDEARPPLRRGLRTPEGEAVATAISF